MVGFGLKNVLVLIALIFITSCGAKKINHNPDLLATDKSDANYMLAEKQCAAKQQVSFGPVANKITLLYNRFQYLYPAGFLQVPIRVYDTNSPLIINLDEMDAQLEKIQEKISDVVYLENNFAEVSSEIYYLYQGIMRFEGQKCALPQLAQRKYQDVRPYLEMKKFCIEKNSSEFCTHETLSTLNRDERHFVKNQIVKMCQSFDSSNVNCHAQLNMRKKKQTFTQLVNYYQERFQNERFDSLLKLKSTHSKFQCSSEADMTIMRLQIAKRNWPINTLNEFSAYLVKAWSSEKFKIIIDLVDKTGADVIEIFPISSAVSYVPDDNNYHVFLTTTLNLEAQKKVLAHEFGHVLGFPDCYIEFFDNKNKDLIYYEIEKDNSNIMCSLRAGVSVPESYFEQLTQNSCIFN